VMASGAASRQGRKRRFLRVWMRCLDVRSP
jgi:hypothetical protein